MDNDKIASMSATRDLYKDKGPTKHRDGFEIIPTTPIDYDLNLTQKYKFTDITYKMSVAEKCARIAFNRPEVLHSFRPNTINEIRKALELASDDTKVGVIILTSELSDKYTAAFCAGGDQTVRSNDGGYDDGTEAAPRLRVLDLQIQMRRCFKPIIAVVHGYAVGGGHILHMCSDLTIAAEDAVFGQTGPRMGSFDAGYGSTIMSQMIGQKRAREMWYLCKFYNAKEALDMGLINAVYAKQHIDGEVARWVRRIIMNSPTAIACIKAALNADQDGNAGVALMGGHLTRLFYFSDESREGRDAFLDGRKPNFRNMSTSRL